MNAENHTTIAAFMEVPRYSDRSPSTTHGYIDDATSFPGRWHKTFGADLTEGT